MQRKLVTDHFYITNASKDILVIYSFDILDLAVEKFIYSIFFFNTIYMTNVKESKWDISSQ